MREWRCTAMFKERDRRLMCLSAIALVLGVLLFGFRGGGLCEKCARLDGVSVSSLVSQWFIDTLP